MLIILVSLAAGVTGLAGGATAADAAQERGWPQSVPLL